MRINQNNYFFISKANELKNEEKKNENEFDERKRNDIVYIWIDNVNLWFVTNRLTYILKFDAIVNLHRLIEIRNNKYNILDEAFFQWISAETPIESKPRVKRNTGLKNGNFYPVTTWGSKTGEGGLCVTSTAKFGKCMSFKSCYPYFKKVPDLSIWDSWVGIVVVA